MPHPRVGPPVSQELMIDPLGDAPAELFDYIVYQVKNRGRVEGWEVILNAEAGRVVESFSTMMNVESLRSRGVVGDEPH